MGKISLTPHNYSLVQEARPFNTLNMSLPGHQQVTKHLQLPERTQKYPRLKHTNQWIKFSQYSSIGGNHTMELPLLESI